MNQMTNVLVLSAGRRVELLKSFQEALKVHFPKSSVYAADLYPELSSACQIAEQSFKAPHVNSEEYINFILELCHSQGIGMLVPTIDTELEALSLAQSKFENNGIQLVVSDSELVFACRDKRKTAEIYTSLGIDQPEIYDVHRLEIPCFCKPYDGSSGIGAMSILSDNDLTDDVINNEKNMFMELVGKEYNEYTIDCYFDRFGQLKCLVPRERIEVRGGEVSKGITRKHFVYDYLLNRLSGLQGARGCLTVQVFGNPETHSVKALEINPRFGGGYPLAHSSGADYPDWLIREYFLGEDIPFFDKWEINLLMLRYDAKVIVHENKVG
jgi:carbamoyl-phosphate synthase large subunit